jgi:hypothetical protein
MTAGKGRVRRQALEVLVAAGVGAAAAVGWVACDLPGLVLPILLVVLGLLVREVHAQVLGRRALRALITLPPPPPGERVVIDDYRALLPRADIRGGSRR